MEGTLLGAAREIPRLGRISLKKRIGEGGIRTLGTLLGYGALAKLCFQPLSHLTKAAHRVEAEYCS
jgi:hypothetical protein